MLLNHESGSGPGRSGFVKGEHGGWMYGEARPTEIEEGRAALPPRFMGDISLGPGVKNPNESDTP